jgi:hypothetical protein
MTTGTSGPRRRPFHVYESGPYYGIFVQFAAGFPRAQLFIVALVGDRSYYFWLFARPRDFEGLVPTARELADSLEIQS